MIRSETIDAVAVLTLDRAEKRNALNIEQCHDLRDALLATLPNESGSPDARVVVITGTDPAFCSGADLDAVYGDQFLDALYQLLAVIHAAPIPVIAAINGPAIGAGLQLALACDLRVGTETARFAIPTAKLGLAVDPTTLRRLEDTAGASVARRLVLACESVDQDEALRVGLLDRAGDLDDAKAWAAELAELAPLTLRYSKEVFNASLTSASADDLDTAFAGVWTSEDLAEGRTARAEKRPPVFRGR